MHNKHTAIFALIVANIIWGATSPIMKWALNDIEPFTLAFFRFGLSSIILLPFAYRHLKLDYKDIWDFVLMTLFGATLGIGLFFLALTYTESINAPLIGSSTPIFVLLISIFFLGEKAKVRNIAGSILALLGIAAIMLEPLAEKGFDGSIIGNLLLIVSTFAGIIHLFMSKKFVEKYHPLTLTFYTFFIGAISFAPFFVQDVIKHGMPVITVQSGIGILYGAIFASAIANYLFFGSEKYLKASEISLFSYATPIIAILVAIPLLGEKVTPMYLLGGILVFAGIYLAEAQHKAHALHHHK